MLLPIFQYNLRMLHNAHPLQSFLFRLLNGGVMSSCRILHPPFLQSVGGEVAAEGDVIEFHQGSADGEDEKAINLINLNNKLLMRDSHWGVNG